MASFCRQRTPLQPLLAQTSGGASVKDGTWSRCSRSLMLLCHSLSLLVLSVSLALYFGVNNNRCLILENYNVTDKTAQSLFYQSQLIYAV